GPHPRGILRVSQASARAGRQSDHSSMSSKIPPHPGAYTSISHLTRRLRYLFLAVGILALGYCATVLLEERLFQAYQSWRFERDLKTAQTPAHADRPPDASPLPAAM